VLIGVSPVKNVSKINVLGKGFVGGRYCELTPNVIVNDRNDYEVKADEVLYFISTIDNYNVHTNPYLDIDTNLTTLIKTLESCRDKDVTFNFISSWFVYGDVPLPAKEDSYCDPKGFYSITKRAAEQLLISYCETFNLKYRIIRLANVLGKSDHKVSKKKNALQYMINEIKEGRDINLYDNGNVFRDYIHVDDVVQAINLIIRSGKTNEIYNVGNGEKIYIGDVLHKVKDKTGSKSNLVNIEAVEFHKKVQTKNMVLNISKLKQLGYTPKYSFDDIIDSLIV
jgi:nucleoside-diphosphate-sugar epimerase